MSPLDSTRFFHWFDSYFAVTTVSLSSGSAPGGSGVVCPELTGVAVPEASGVAFAEDGGTSVNVQRPKAQLSMYLALPATLRVDAEPLSEDFGGVEA